MKKILLIILLFSQYLNAQNTINFDTEDYYYIHRSEYLKIDLDKEKFNIEKEVYEQAKYNTANKLFFSNDFIHFDSFTEIKDIEAFTETSNSKVNVDHFETKDQFGGSVFFSDQQSINFVFPAVSKNATTTLKYKELIKDPHFLGSFRFGTYVPTKEASFTVEVPKNVELGYKSFNLDKIDLKFEKKETKKTTIYSWKAKNIGDYRKGDKSLSILKYIPHIIVHIKNYEYKNETKPILSNVNDLYSWYSSLINQIKDSDLTEVYSIADKLVKNTNNDYEKTKLIFNWVQNNIQYIAFEDGLGGFVPRDAASVCNKRYGDCKDMANILYEMLNHVGIKAYHTWIGTRDRPYSYYEVPTPIVDNHMITTVIIEDKSIFLDATDSYVPFGMPSSFTQGKEALIGLDDDSFKIIKVPIMEKEKSSTLIESTLKLNGNSLTASGKRTMKGYDMVDFVYDAKFKKDDKTDEEYLNNKYKIGNNKTTYSNIDLGSLDITEDSYTISYDLEINNYAKKIGSKLFLNLNIEKTLSDDILLPEKERFGKKIDHKYNRTYKTSLIIPEGYIIKSLPKKIENQQKNYGFSIDFKNDGNKIIVQKNIYFDILEINNEQYQEYNTFIKSLIKAYKKSIVLEKKS